MRSNAGACRYVKSMRPLQKLRDEEWWGETMAGLRPTLQQSTQPQRRLAHTTSLKASTPQPGGWVCINGPLRSECLPVVRGLET